MSGEPLTFERMRQLLDELPDPIPDPFEGKGVVGTQAQIDEVNRQRESIGWAPIESVAAGVMVTPPELFEHFVAEGADPDALYLVNLPEPFVAWPVRGDLLR